MNSQKLELLARTVGLPIQELPTEAVVSIKNAPQAQLRTAKFKKAVKIVGKQVFKGPYSCNDAGLMNNQKFTYAIQLLEEALHLPEWQRGSLPWECIGQSCTDQYYLVAPNVGKCMDIPSELKSSKIETDVPIVPRGGAIWRVSDIEKNGQLTDGIKLAALQHLYFRFLLDIGDSGTHNVLIREDSAMPGRLVAGIDLEEKRTSRTRKQRLDKLFKKGASKSEKSLYQSNIKNIRVLTYDHLASSTINRLLTVGIDIERLKANMASW